MVQYWTKQSLDIQKKIKIKELPHTHTTKNQIQMGNSLKTQKGN